MPLIFHVYPSKLKDQFVHLFLQVFEMSSKNYVCSSAKWLLKLSDINEKWNGATIFSKIFQYYI
jgi:hypothetical protein